MKNNTEEKRRKIFFHTPLIRKIRDDTASRLLLQRNDRFDAKRKLTFCDRSRATPSGFGRSRAHRRTRETVIQRGSATPRRNIEQGLFSRLEARLFRFLFLLLCVCCWLGLRAAADMAAKLTDLLACKPPSPVGHWELMKKLGEGNYGSVYKVLFDPRKKKRRCSLCVGETRQDGRDGGHQVRAVDGGRDRRDPDGDQYSRGVAASQRGQLLCYGLLKRRPVGEA